MSLWDMGSSEFLERLADVLDSARSNEKVPCKDGCGTIVVYGPRCENCRRKKHAAAEKARSTKRKKEEESAT